MTSDVPASGGFELWRDPSPPSRPCAFCRQEVGGAPSTTCPRCGTIYHPDCWAANDRRCAVYGCAPAIVAAPPPPPPRPEPARSTGSGWGRGGTILVVVVLINVVRLVVQAVSHRSPEVQRVPRIDVGQRQIVDLAREKEDARTILLRAEALRSMGKVDEALQEFDRAIALNPALSLARQMRGHLRVDRGDLEGAVEDFTAAWESNPRVSDAIYDRACALYDLGRWEECLADFAQVYQQLPSLAASAQARHCLARARLGQRAAAERDLAAFLDRSWHGDPWSHAVLRFVAGRSDEATLFAETERRPTDGICLASFYAGTRRLLDGEREAAAAYFRRCVQAGSPRIRERASAAAELRALEKKK